MSSPAPTRQVTALEPHYTPKQLAELWGYSENTIRNIFREQDGVLRIGSSFRRGKQGYVSMRIPESVAQRVHEELSRVKYPNA